MRRNCGTMMFWVVYLVPGYQSDWDRAKHVLKIQEET